MPGLGALILIVDVAPDVLTLVAVVTGVPTFAGLCADATVVVSDVLTPGTVAPGTLG